MDEKARRSRPHGKVDRHSLWVRVTLTDGEVLNGVVDNDLLLLQSQVTSGRVTVAVRPDAPHGPRTIETFPIAIIKELAVIGTIGMGSKWKPRRRP
jgi:hypothetical protein